LLIFGSSILLCLNSLLGCNLVRHLGLLGLFLAGSGDLGSLGVGLLGGLLGIKLFLLSSLLDGNVGVSSLNLLVLSLAVNNSFLRLDISLLLLQLLLELGLLFESDLFSGLLLLAF